MTWLDTGLHVHVMLVWMLGLLVLLSVPPAEPTVPFVTYTPPPTVSLLP